MFFVSQESILIEWPKPFREVFCEHYQCSQDAYVMRVFWHCLYRHAMPLASMLHSRNPDFFREDFDAIREIGTAQSHDVFRNEINRFYGRNLREKKWLRRSFLIRVSGKRLMKVKNKLFRTS
jgi:hypothetical protein